MIISNSKIFKYVKPVTIDRTNHTFVPALVIDEKQNVVDIIFTSQKENLMVSKDIINWTNLNCVAYEYALHNRLKIRQL